MPMVPGPVHIHFVVQPVDVRLMAKFAAHGPKLQVAMFESRTPLNEAQVDAFADAARRSSAVHEKPVAPNPAEPWTRERHQRRTATSTRPSLPLPSVSTSSPASHECGRRPGLGRGYCTLGMLVGVGARAA